MDACIHAVPICCCDALLVSCAISRYLPAWLLIAVLIEVGCLTPARDINMVNADADGCIKMTAAAAATTQHSQVDFEFVGNSIP